MPDAVFWVYLYRDEGTGAYGRTRYGRVPVPALKEGVAHFEFDELALLPGAFDVDIGIIDPPRSLALT